MLYLSTLFIVYINAYVLALVIGSLSDLLMAYITGFVVINVLVLVLHVALSREVKESSIVTGSEGVESVSCQ